MNNRLPDANHFPRLEALLAQKGLSLLGIYTNHDAARIFGVSARTIQDWCRDGKLQVRDLPGRGDFYRRI
ncbi:MAG: helix-turn-helix domain-containing protein [Acidobacteria bacterium]|nr:helix-turn-helix domain-containing protein [Acidobacteriota bacterium]